VRELVFALAAAAAGLPPGRALAREAALRGKRVAALPAAAAGERPARLEVPADLREIWEERTSIMVYDGHVPRAEAERLAWAGLLPQGKAP